MPGLLPNPAKFSKKAPLSPPPVHSIESRLKYGHSLNSLGSGHREFFCCPWRQVSLGNSFVPRILCGLGLCTFSPIVIYLVAVPSPEHTMHTKPALSNVPSNPPLYTPVHLVHILSYRGPISKQWYVSLPRVTIGFRQCLFKCSPNVPTYEEQKDQSGLNSLWVHIQ